jgi:hypothetical protein
MYKKFMNVQRRSHIPIFKKEETMNPELFLKFQT